MRNLCAVAAAADASPAPAANLPTQRQSRVQPPFSPPQNSQFGGASPVSRLRLSANTAAMRKFGVNAANFNVICNHKKIRVGTFN
jgi:hypothetical protein